MYHQGWLEMCAQYDHLHIIGGSHKHFFKKADDTKRGDWFHNILLEGTMIIGLPFTTYLISSSALRCVWNLAKTGLWVA